MPRLVPAVALALGLLLTGCGSAGTTSTTSDQESPRSDPIDVSVSDCGTSWDPTRAGEQELVLHNSDASPGEVQLIGRGRDHGLVYADVEPFGPGTTVSVHVRLASGSYALACLMEDKAPVTGPTRTVTGSSTGTPGVRILTQSRLVPATQRYETWLRAHVRPLVRDTGRLRDAADAGDRDAAQVAWLRAHQDYQRLGAAYDAFGDVGDAVDGLPSGLPGGTSSRHWTGFHRVEQDLWGHATTTRLRQDADTLDRDVRRLPALVRSARLDPLTLTLRAHEIAENALQFQLTGQDDFGSHSDVQSVRAELVGTAAVLRALGGPIRQRVARHQRIRTSLRQTLSAYTAASRGPRLAVAWLPRLERERLDASLSRLTELLAAIPATLEPRLTVASQIGDGS